VLIATLKDLSRFTYYPGIDSGSLLAVGWLGKTSKFTAGSISPNFLQRLASLISDSWLAPFASAGWHDCELCAPGTRSANWIGEIEIASASHREIFVPYEGRIFVSPESIGHYVACHRYCPPKEFIVAVETCPPVRSMDYKKLLLECGGGVLLGKPEVG